MEIGTIGAGALAQAFAKRALKAGHKVKLSNDRGPDSLREIVNRLGPGAMAATKSAAAGRSKSFSARTISTATPRNDTDTSTGHFRTPS